MTPGKSKLNSLTLWRLKHVALPAACAILSALLLIALGLRENTLQNLAPFTVAAIAIGIGLALLATLLALSAFSPAASEELAGDTQTTEAGKWIVHKAFGKLPPNDPRTQRYPLATQPIPPPPPLQKDLQDWLDDLSRQFKDQAGILRGEMERDLEMATEFQQAFLNRPYPQVPAVYIEGRLRLEFHHVYKPTFAVGGDFFDIIPVGSDCAGLFITDVMGHGVRSALMTAILRALLSELSNHARNAPHFIRELNREFCAILDAMPDTYFASAFYFVADTTSRIGTFANAGHPPPYLIHRDRAKVQRLATNLTKSIALGILPHETYAGDTVRLQDGQTFLFFTDGVFECANPDGEEYGLQRLEKVLQANVYKKTPELLEAVVASINQFTRGEPLADDLCLLALDVTTSPPQSPPPS